MQEQPHVAAEAISPSYRIVDPVQSEPHVGSVDVGGPNDASTSDHPAGAPHPPESVPLLDPDPPELPEDDAASSPALPLLPPLDTPEVPPDPTRSRCPTRGCRWTSNRRWIRYRPSCRHPARPNPSSRRASRHRARQITDAEDRTASHRRRRRRVRARPIAPAA